MDDRVLGSRDDQRARAYSAQIHRLDHEPVQDQTETQLAATCCCWSASRLIGLPRDQLYFGAAAAQAEDRPSEVAFRAYAKWEVGVQAHMPVTRDGSPFFVDWLRGLPMQNSCRSWHGGRVLVCDDNLLMAEVVAEFLRECGLEPIGPCRPVGKRHAHGPRAGARWRNPGHQPQWPTVFSDLRDPVGPAHSVHVPHRLSAGGNSNRIPGRSFGRQAVRAE